MRQTVLRKHKQTKACTNSLGHIELSVANELQQYYVSQLGLGLLVFYMGLNISLSVTRFNSSTPGPTKELIVKKL